MTGIELLLGLIVLVLLIGPGGLLRLAAGAGFVIAGLLLVAALDTPQGQTVMLGVLELAGLGAILYAACHPRAVWRFVRDRLIEG